MTPPIRDERETVEALNAKLGSLIDERQSLRATAADDETLERNRVEIARLQRLLARALVARYGQAATA